MTKTDVEWIASFIVSFSYKNDVFEDETVLRFTDINKVNDDDLGKLKSIRIPLEELCTIYIQADIDIDLNIEQLQLSDFKNQHVSFVFTKKNTENKIIFFTGNGFSTFLGKSNTLPESICLIDDFEPFFTYTTSIVPPFATKIHSNNWNGIVDSRKIVRNYSKDYSIVTNINSWILTNQNKLQDKSCYYKTFITESSKKLFVLLSNEIFTVNGITYLEFNCDRKVNIDVTLFEKESESFYKNSNTIEALITWVFENANEFETRHTLLNYQLALESIAEEKIRFENLLLSLQNAKNSYNYFLRSKSKEMMCSLTDLKKSISVELSEHNKNTYNIVKNMWRDFMFAAIAIAYDIFTAKNNYQTNNSILLFVATAITLSYIISVISELRYQNIVMKNMQTWYPQLYSFLSSEEMNRLIKKPIKSIRNSLYIILLITFILYLTVDCIILRNIIPLLKFIQF